MKTVKNLSLDVSTLSKKTVKSFDLNYTALNTSVFLQENIGKTKFNRDSDLKLPLG